MAIGSVGGLSASRFVCSVASSVERRRVLIASIVEELLDQRTNSTSGMRVGPEERQYKDSVYEHGDLISSCGGIEMAKIRQLLLEQGTETLGVGAGDLVCWVRIGGRHVGSGKYTFRSHLSPGGTTAWSRLPGRW
jgi:hypothetical protein